VTSVRGVRVQVGALRRKLELDSSSPLYIVTEPWIGYRFAAEPLA
jgi:DNA-binding response OmpR family regulator